MQVSISRSTEEKGTVERDDLEVHWMVTLLDLSGRFNDQRVLIKNSIANTWN